MISISRERSARSWCRSVKSGPQATFRIARLWSQVAQNRAIECSRGKNHGLMGAARSAVGRESPRILRSSRE